jgi:hypothetical protein
MPFGNELIATRAYQKEPSRAGKNLRDFRSRLCNIRPSWGEPEGNVYRLFAFS